MKEDAGVGKRALRQELLARRAARPEPERAAAGALLRDRVLTLPELAGMSAGGTVAGYVSLGTEPPTAALLAALLERGLRVLLPVLLADGDLDWAELGQNDLVQGDPERGGLVPGRRGLLEPGGRRLGPDAVGEAGVVVVPGLAAGRDGVRMGRGGGSYDRALHRLPAGATRVLLLWDGELREAVPAEPHDQRVDVVVTPSATVRLPLESRPPLESDDR